MSTGTEFFKALLEGADPEKLAAFLREIKPDNIPDSTFAKKYKAERQNGLIKTYTTVIKQYTCVACDSHFSTAYNMQKGEQTFCISPTGEVKSITISGKPGELVLQSYASKCSFCEETIATWDKEKLAQRYIALLEACTFKEIVTHSNSVLEKS